MVLRLALLSIAALCAGLTAAPALSAGDPRCLVCHPPHYRDQGSCSHCHRGNEQTSRPDLAHKGLIGRDHAGFRNPQDRSAAAGLRLADQSACRRCHIMHGRGNRLAANLDLTARTTSPSRLDAAIATPALYMPDFHFSRYDRNLLTSAILAGYRHVPETLSEPPRSVHFSRPDQRRTHPFAVACGGCHRALTASSGPWGSGSSAPDLSGLLSPYYSVNYPVGLPWSAERLQRWVANPIKLREATLMRPVRLRKDELQKVLELLKDSGSLPEQTAAENVKSYNNQLKR